MGTTLPTGIILPASNDNVNRESNNANLQVINDAILAVQEDAASAESTASEAAEALVTHMADLAHESGKLYAYNNIGGAL